MATIGAGWRTSQEEPHVTQSFEIVGWVEKGDGKRTKGPLAWIHLNTDQGYGYSVLAARHGPAGWGVWCSLLMEAARKAQEKRGKLRGSLEDLALITRFPVDAIAPIISTLKEIGWLSGGSPEISGDLPLEEKRGDEKRGDEKTPPPPKPPAPEAVALAQALYDAIVSHTPDFKADEKKLLGWAKTFGIELRRKDGFSADEMLLVIDYAHRHEERGFWRSNLLSATKVRKHTQRLIVEAKQRGNGRGLTVADLLADIDFPEEASDGRP